MTIPLIRSIENSVVTIILIAVPLLNQACKPLNPFTYTPISKNVVVDSNRQALVFDSPFLPRKQVNDVCFNYKGDLRIPRYISEPPEFTDGVALKLDVILVEESGKHYKADKTTENGPNYLCFAPSNHEEWLKISEKNVKFVKIFLSSNRKLEVSKIEWKSYNAWDFK